MSAAQEWVIGGDTGLSSRHIWAHMMGVRRSKIEKFSPLDPADFGRCYRLLVQVPEWRARIGEMASYGKAWAGLAAHWDELTALFEEEVGVGLASYSVSGTAPKLYARMKEVRGDRA